MSAVVFKQIEAGLNEALSLAQGDLAAPVRVSMTVQEQADFVLALSDRNFMADGERAGEWTPLLTKHDAEVLYAIGMRLTRIAPHEAAVKAMVTGRPE